MKHNFHFVLNKNLKNKIAEFADLNKMSLSEAVVYIFNFMKPVLEKHFLKDVSCENPGYSYCDANTDMHVFFKKTDYKYLRQVQSNLYCYSIALILRFTLSKFFNGVKKYGFKKYCKIVCRFGKVYLKIKCNFSKKNFSINPETRHMFHSIKNFNQICHIFDYEYNLLKTKFS